MIEFEMSNGVKIPAVGYGVFEMTSTEVRECLPQAIEIGFRHIDTANGYYNEVAVGEVIASSGVPREEFFVTTKLWPRDYGYADCKKAINATLRRLGMDYVDLLLFHQPYGDYVSGWKAMEEALAEGKVRSIGLSNFTRPKFQEVLDGANIAPHALQVEINPRCNQKAMKDWLESFGVVFEGWYPLGHGDKSLLELPEVMEPAAKHGKTPSQVILRWHVQSGNVVFPKTLNPAHMAENIDVFDFELDAEEMARIDAVKQHPYYQVPDEKPAWIDAMSSFDQQK